MSDEKGLARVDMKDLAIPDFMQNEKSGGTEEIGQYQLTPRIAIVQSSSARERKQQYGEAAAFISPDGILVAEPEGSFHATPLVGWMSWEKWSDINDASKPMVVEVSQDPQSDIALRSRSRDKRREPYGEDGEFEYKYMECINFIVYIHDGDAAGETAILTYSSGDWAVGRRMNKELDKRWKNRSVPIFGNIFEFKINLRDRGNEWFGFDWNNPTDESGFSAVVQDANLYAKFRDMHQQLAKMVNAGRVVANREEGDNNDSPEVDAPDI